MKLKGYLRCVYIGLGALLLGFGQVETVAKRAIATPVEREDLLMVESIDHPCSPLLSEEDDLEIESLSETGGEPEEICSTDVVNKDTICQTGLTVPSLWWADEQFGDKLLENWLAYPNKKRIDLIVNRQRWGLMDYYERYAFVHRMGAVVRGNSETGETGYNLRVFNRQEPALCLAAYTCENGYCGLQITGFGPSLNTSR